MSLYEICSRVVYSYQIVHTTVEGTELDALLAFFRERARYFTLVPAYGQTRPETLSQIVKDAQGRSQRVRLPLPDWVWDRPSELSPEHPLFGVAQ